jgi:imidazoleglycerol-phosphate dehydratase
MRTRTATVRRQTGETSVEVTLNLDGSGRHAISTGIGFLDHLLAHMAVHGLLDLEVQVSGDLQVDPHHTLEDIALVLGQALDEALGERRGIVRMGSAWVPMDEVLAFVSLDLSGRAYAVTEFVWSGADVGGLPVTLMAHFFRSWAGTARATVHARVPYGEDNHHCAEALFKALGRALEAATREDPRRAGTIPSTKGAL